MFLERPIEGSWPYLWIDATYVKVREGGRIISVAVIIAVAANTDGRREVIGMAVGPSEAEPFWTKFLRSLTARGLRGVKLVISDSHEGLKKAAAKVLGTTWQRCRVHFMRNAMASVAAKQRGIVAAAIRTAFVQETRKEAHTEWRAVADRLRERFPKISVLMDDAEHDVLGYLSFPKAHWSQIHSTNPIERLNREVKRRTNVVQIFPNDDAIVRLVGPGLGPGPRHQVGQTRARPALGHAVDDVGEVGVRVDPVEPAGLDDGVDMSRASTALVAAKKKVVLARDRDRAQRPLGRVVVDREAAVAGIARERVPASETVLDRLAERVLAWKPLSLRLEPGLERGQ